VTNTHCLQFAILGALVLRVMFDVTIPALPLNLVFLERLAGQVTHMSGFTEKKPEISCSPDCHWKTRQRQSGPSTFRAARANPCTGDKFRRPFFTSRPPPE
jgi:hypothetical protein